MLQAPSLEPVSLLYCSLRTISALPVLKCYQELLTSGHSQSLLTLLRNACLQASKDGLIEGTFQFAHHCCLPNFPSVISETAECGTFLSVHPLHVGLSDKVYVISNSPTSTISAPAHSLSSYFYT